MPTRNPENLHRRFADLMNDSDLDGLLALCEQGATLAGPDGGQAQGTEAMRERLEGLLAMAPSITPISSRALAADDVALSTGRGPLHRGTENMLLMAIIRLYKRRGRDSNPRRSQ